MSRHLQKRMSALEAARGSDLWKLSDDEIAARLVDVCERIERHPDRQPGMQADNWRGLIAAQNYKPLGAYHA